MAHHSYVDRRTFSILRNRYFSNQSWMDSRHAVSSCICKNFLWKYYHPVPATRRTQSFWRPTLPRSKVFTQPLSCHHQLRPRSEPLFHPQGNIRTQHRNKLSSLTCRTLLDPGAHQTTHTFHKPRKCLYHFMSGFYQGVMRYNDMYNYIFRWPKCTHVLRCSNTIIMKNAE